MCITEYITMFTCSFGLNKLVWDQTKTFINKRKIISLLFFYSNEWLRYTSISKNRTNVQNVGHWWQITFIFIF